MSEKFVKVFIIKMAPESIDNQNQQLVSPLYHHLQGQFDSLADAEEAIEMFYANEPVFQTYFIVPCYVMRGI